MHASFSLICLVVFMGAIAAHWRSIEGGAGKIVFVGLALLSFGALTAYMLKIQLFFPARWIVGEIVPYIVRMVGGE
jgi:hypothetical protein